MSSDEAYYLAVQDANIPKPIKSREQSQSKLWKNTNPQLAFGGKNKDSSANVTEGGKCCNVHKDQ